jgi:hypothetical protein
MFNFKIKSINFFLCIQIIGSNEYLFAKNNEIKAFNDLPHGVSLINSYRENNGLPKFSYNIDLENSSKNHALYLIKNEVVSHDEENTFSPYFTGEKVWNRTSFANYIHNQVGENLTYGVDDYQTSINLLMTAIYHRFGFLSYDFNEFGMYGANKVSVFNFGNNLTTKICENAKNNKLLPGMLYNNKLCNNNSILLEKDINKISNNKKELVKYVIFPYDNLKNVLPAFYDESPDPLPDKIVSGNPISIQFNQEKVNKIKINKFQLFAGNQEVKNTRLITIENDVNKKFLKYEYALFPLDRLEWNKRYYVIFEAYIDGSLFEKKWSFETVSLKAPLVFISNEYNFKKLYKNKIYSFYFDPNVFGNVMSFKSNCEIGEVIDYNTMYVTYPKEGECFIMLNNDKTIILN